LFFFFLFFLRKFEWIIALHKLKGYRYDLLFTETEDWSTTVQLLHPWWWSWNKGLLEEISSMCKNFQLSHVILLKDYLVREYFYFSLYRASSFYTSLARLQNTTRRKTIGYLPWPAMRKIHAENPRIETFCLTTQRSGALGTRRIPNRNGQNCEWAKPGLNFECRM